MNKPIPIFDAKIIKGKVKMPNFMREKMNNWVKLFPDETRVDIIIRKHKKVRTNPQNRYYWGVVIPILAHEFGYDNKDDIHNDLKRKFNPIPSKIDPDKKIGGTTATMSTEDFMSSETSYVERICRWAAQEGIYIPPPERIEDEEKTI